MDWNQWGKVKKYGLIPYQIEVYDELKDGETSRGQITNSGFKVNFIYWSNELLVKMLENAGFEAECCFITKEVVNANLYSEE